VKYAQTTAQRPMIRIGIAGHLLDWTQARYRVKACNPSGCSTSNEVGVNHGEKLDAIGFFKPYVTGDAAYTFGGKLAASADGRNIAVVSNEDVGGVEHAGVVHVYRRATSTSGWKREVRLLPSVLQNTGGQYYIGDPISMSADGSLLAFGQWSENVPGAPQGTGAVYLYRREGTTWRLAQTIRGNTAVYGDYFGYAVKLDDAGRTLAVMHHNLDGVYSWGTVEVYQILDDSSDQFVHVKTLPISPRSNGDAGRCEALGLSGDGKTLMRSCAWDSTSASTHVVQVYKAPGWIQTTGFVSGQGEGLDMSYDASQVIVQFVYFGIVWRLGPTGYVEGPALSNFDESGVPYRHVAISRDGKIAAIGNEYDLAAGLGPIFPPYQTADFPSGGVVVYQRKNDGTWTLRRAIKPGSTNTGLFGHSIALADNGRLLVVGAPRDQSAATGIDGDRNDDAVDWRGAVWLY
jgi:trimeric autotransporter adhesin